MKTNIVDILKVSLVGKYLTDIYIDGTDSSYGYLKIPMDGMYDRVDEGVIEDVIVDFPEYETGSVDVIVKVSEEQKVRVNISYHDFNIIDWYAKAGN